MTELTEKEALLENAGYKYHFDRMIYFNRGTRKAFSLEFVEDHSHQEIQQRVGKAATRRPSRSIGEVWRSASMPSARITRMSDSR